MEYTISYISQYSETNVDNDNIDVCVSCDNEKEFTFVIATIKNVEQLLENGILNPAIKLLIVDKLTQTKIEGVIDLVMQDEKLRSFYGAD